jgi:hypothetical protein
MRWWRIRIWSATRGSRFLRRRVRHRLRFWVPLARVLVLEKVIVGGGAGGKRAQGWKEKRCCSGSSWFLQEVDPVEWVVMSVVLAVLGGDGYVEHLKALGLEEYWEIVYSTLRSILRMSIAVFMWMQIKRTHGCGGFAVTHKCLAALSRPGQI